MTDRAAALEAMLEVPEGAGLVEIYVNEEGKDAMRFTTEGARVAPQMAMSSEDGQDALLVALVEAAQE